MMTELQSLTSPLAFLGSLIDDQTQLDVLKELEAWWQAEGLAISTAVDRAGTP
jgi:hypothetical protein